MSGPSNCFVCSAKFNLFKKQHECKKCHCAACKSCLSNSVVLPGLGSSPQPICKLCYNALQNKVSTSGRVSPPANFKREIAKKKEKEKLDAANAPDPQDELITERLRKLKESYDRKDISVDEIQSRLQKLCASEPSVTMEELEYRLAKLKGSRPPAIRVHSIRKRPSSTEAHCSSDASDRMQVKRLIRQYTDEIAMETGRTDLGPENFQPSEVPTNPTADDLIELARVELRRSEDLEKEGKLQEDEIRKRLSQLTDAPKVPIADATLGIQSNVHFDEEGMDEETANLIRQLLEEDRMEQNLRETGVVLPQQTTNNVKSDSGKKIDDMKEEELPWCFMCNDDATIRCLTCDDLFCDTCFRLVHRERGMKGHKTKKFVNENPDSP